MIDHLTAERIKAAADIVDVVGDYVKLTRRGANYMGLCPFHNERTPSFSVNKAKNFCYCFSCHKGGSPVNFIMEKEGISYQDALRQLAKKYGIKIEERELTDEERRLRSERESLFMAGEWAMQGMERNLTATTDGRAIGLQYLYQRGITDEAIRKFHLGYSPDRNVLEQEAIKDGYDPESLKKIGLLGVNQQGYTYDRFKGRVIYPVLNTAGKVVAFGGRDLKGGPAKYINSPESEIYKKSNELYGLYQARQAIVKADKCFLVEGYMDVIGMWQAGMENVISSSGTALTDAQIALIHRFTNNVTLLYDGDAAGVKASIRGIDMLLSHDLNIKVLLLPDGHDPDSFARENTTQQFRDYVEAHEEDFITFKTKVLMKEGATDPQSRAAVASSIVESLACISDKIKRSLYIKECSSLLGIDEQTLSYETDSRRHKVVEKLKTERRKKEENTSLDALTPIMQPNENNEEKSTAKGVNEGEDYKFATTTQKGIMELRKIEGEIMKYCVRYGMLPFIYNDDGTPSELLFEYVRNDMSTVDSDWHDPLYAGMFNEIAGMKPDYEREQEKYTEECLKLRADKYLEETEKIRAGSYDMPELEHKDKQLLEKLDEEYNKRIEDFARKYIVDKLANHERDDYRKAATGMISERHILSKYHSKTGHVASEAERIFDLLPRALSERRAQIIANKISELDEKLKQTSDEGQQDELLKNMQILQNERKELARINGEKIINPRQ